MIRTEYDTAPVLPRGFTLSPTASRQCICTFTPLRMHGLYEKLNLGKNFQSNYPWHELWFVTVNLLMNLFYWKFCQKKFFFWSLTPQRQNWYDWLLLTHKLYWSVLSTVLFIFCFTLLSVGVSMIKNTHTNFLNITNALWLSYTELVISIAWCAIDLSTCIVRRIFVDQYLPTDFRANWSAQILIKWIFFLGQSPQQLAKLSKYTTHFATSLTHKLGHVICKNFALIM